jgi:hypothetical protein
MRLIEEALARQMLGQLQLTELPAAATQAIVDGLDSPSLRILAGLEADPRNNREIESHFRRTCAELNVGYRDKRDAALYLRTLWAGDICEGRIPPFDGCCRIVRQIYYGARDLFNGENLCGEALGIEDFVGCYYSYFDEDAQHITSDGSLAGQEDMRKILDKAVLAAAQKANQSQQTARAFSSRV